MKMMSKEASTSAESRLSDSETSGSEESAGPTTSVERRQTMTITTKPVFKVQPLFVKQCGNSQLNTDWYVRGSKLDPRRPFTSFTVGSTTKPENSFGKWNCEEGNLLKSNPKQNIANRILNNNNDLFSLYAAEVKQPEKQWPNTGSMDLKIPMDSGFSDPLSAKRLSDLDNLLFPRIQDLNKSRASSVVSVSHEKSTDVINMERMKNKSTLLNHFFEDGKRKVDYILVYHKVTNVHPKSDEMVMVEQRTIFEVRKASDPLAWQEARNCSCTRSMVEFRVQQQH